MSKINQQKVYKNFPDTILEGIRNIKHKILPKLDTKKMEQIPDEFVSEAERLKYDPDVKAFDYIHSNDGQELISKMRAIFQEKSD